MFDAEAHRPYRELCVKLGLDWTWKEGDYYWSPELGAVVLLAGSGGPAKPTAVPLPRSDQLDEILEEAGVTDLLIKRVLSNGWYRCYPNPTAEEFPFGQSGLMTAGQSREEAKLRLWCAVKGWKVT